MKRKIKILVLIFLKTFGFFHLAKYLTRRNLKILCYHGFSSEDQYFYDDFLFIRKETFARRMDILKSWNMNVADLDEAVQGFQNGNNKDNSIVITFDDGWKSTAEGVPALQKNNFPSTLYIASYYCNKEFPVFNVVVRYVAWKVKNIENLKNNFEKKFNVQLSDKALVFHCAIDEIVDYGNSHSLEMKKEIMDFILSVSGVKLKENMFTYLNQEELKKIISDGVSLELHTHRHRFPDDRALIAEDLEKNRDFLFPYINKVGAHLCYPSGVYFESQFKTLQELGVKSATTTINKPNKPGTNIYDLGRFLDRDGHHDIEFEAAVCGVFDVLK